MYPDSVADAKRARGRRVKASGGKCACVLEHTCVATARLGAAPTLRCAELVTMATGARVAQPAREACIGRGAIAADAFVACVAFLNSYHWAKMLHERS